MSLSFRGSFKDRGPLLNARQIRQQIFAGSRTERWIRKNVAPSKRIRLGHSTLLWYERDVFVWVDEARDSDHLGT